MNDLNLKFSQYNQVIKLNVHLQLIMFWSQQNSTWPRLLLGAESHSQHKARANISFKVKQKNGILHEDCAIFHFQGLSCGQNYIISHHDILCLKLT